MTNPNIVKFFNNIVSTYFMLERIISLISSMESYIMSTKENIDNVLGRYSVYVVPNNDDTINHYFTNSTIPYAEAIKYNDGTKEYYSSGTVSVEDIVERDNEVEAVSTSYNDYMSGPGRIFEEYLDSKGLDTVEIKGVSSATLGPRVVAAIRRNEREGIIIANENYDAIIPYFACAHGLYDDEAVEFVYDHEKAHSAYIDSEEDVFRTQLDYYNYRMQNAETSDEHDRYERMAMAAHQRYANERNNPQDN